MEIKEVSAKDIPVSLLLLADPSKANIQTYLAKSWSIAAIQDQNIIGACIAKQIRKDTVEVFNVAVYPAHQQQGIGTQLLNNMITKLKRLNVSRIELGTGTFGYQLNYYQRLGFRVCNVWRDHFIKHYEEPLYENGLQHFDMLRLELVL